VYTIIATVGMVLAALYILLMYQRTMNGPPRGVLLEELPPGAPVGPVGGESAHDSLVSAHGGGADGHGATATATLTEPTTAARARLRIRDLSSREIAVVTPLIALIIALGVYPQPLLNLIRPAVAATMSDVGSNPHGITPTHAAPNSDEGN
jgi:NADH-quinone oxidoreductase subunit M